MVSPFIKALVRTQFLLTRRDQAAKQARRILLDYQTLARGIDALSGAKSVEVPPMRGVDEDMRRWSFFMILEHNTIVNRSITAMVHQLAGGQSPHGAAAIDPKHDVMPSATADAEQLTAFEESVLDHVRTVRDLGPLRGTGTSLHPVFGFFDAHQWNCMFSFHLKLHLPQARCVAGVVRKK